MKNGCFNKPRPVAGAVTHLAQAGWSETFRDGFGAPHRTPILVDIKHVMTTECQYTLTTPDPACAGCVHEKKEGKGEG